MTPESQNTLNSRLAEACYKDNVDSVQSLIEQGATVNETNQDLLIMAVLYSSTETVEILSHHGAELHFQNDRALRESTKSKDCRMMQYLLDKGLDIHAENNSFIKYCTNIGLFSTIKEFFYNGFRIESIQDQKEILGIAADNGYLNIVEYLVIEQNFESEFLLKNRHNRYGAKVNYCPRPHVRQWIENNIESINLKKKLDNSLILEEKSSIPKGKI